MRSQQTSPSEGLDLPFPLSGDEEFLGWRMNYYCTLFDSSYLARGLALYESIVETSERFHLFVFCFDDLAFELVCKLQLPYVTAIALAEFEAAELSSVKSTRTRKEYCWTATPIVIDYALKQFNLPAVTYLDADLFFFSPPSLLLEELKLNNGSVLITEHRYTPKYDLSADSGVYCVQFMTFKADLKGQEVLKWWKERCLEWCHDRFEDGKFGDQKYLDDWATRFEGVHVLQHLGGGVAPWNIQQYSVSEGPKVNDVPIVFYHFHSLICYRKDSYDLTSYYRLPKSARLEIYEPYLASLKRQLQTIRKVHPGFNKGLLANWTGLRSFVRDVIRRLTGRYYVVQR